MHLGGALVHIAQVDSLLCWYASPASWCRCLVFENLQVHRWPPLGAAGQLTLKHSTILLKTSVDQYIVPFPWLLQQPRLALKSSTKWCCSDSSCARCCCSCTRDSLSLDGTRRSTLPSRDEKGAGCSARVMHAAHAADSCCSELGSVGIVDQGWCSRNVPCHAGRHCYGLLCAASEPEPKTVTCLGAIEANSNKPKASRLFNRLCHSLHQLQTA